MRGRAPGADGRPGDGRAMTEGCPGTAGDVRGVSGVYGSVRAGAASYLLSAGVGLGRGCDSRETPQLGGDSRGRRDAFDNKVTIFLFFPKLLTVIIVLVLLTQNHLST